MFNNSVKSQIRNNCLDVSKEQCGFVLFNNGYQVYRVNNRSNDPHHFVIDPKDYVKASINGKIMAVYHSHISDNEQFTDYDVINANNHNMVYILYVPSKDVFHFYEPQSKQNKYVGRSFVYGQADCFSLIRDYYLNELGISIVDVGRDSDWYENNCNLILDSYKQFEGDNFVMVNRPNKHDVLLFKYGENRAPHHFGVYLGDHLFLHHPRFKYSTIGCYDNIWKKRTHTIFRHKSLMDEMT